MAEQEKLEGLEQGLVQIYTGNCKGKSTAAFGLALRAAGYGLKVHIIQFMKTPDYGEHKSFPRLAPEIEVKTFGRKGFIVDPKKPKQEDIDQATAAMNYARKVIKSGNVDVLILDEINNAIYFNLIKEEEVLEFLKQRPKNVEIILTGRNAPESLIEIADLVTDMRQVKHPYEQGINARKGIEY
ncbi:MAG: cob(I)alamin adenosyltransferase [Clostridia bacterium]|nr:cob(I)alamin adenosyltransferase [Clostridia bacterium]